MKKNYITNTKFHLKREKCVVAKGAKAFELATATVKFKLRGNDGLTRFLSDGTIKL